MSATPQNWSGVLWALRTTEPCPLQRFGVCYFRSSSSCHQQYCPQIGYFRTTTATFIVFFVILVFDPMGRSMTRILPDYTVPLGRFSFSLVRGARKTCLGWYRGQYRQPRTVGDLSPDQR
ncbi:hypothetical protein B0H14DRAFT_2816682 [Mycena olivaceomarginata]|nr:hypothetical protein B0H14DRAFT_2816682 [Mycena olivaceomarginata]